MTRIRIEQLLWDEWNVEHIKKHQVTRYEVEEAVVNVQTHKIVKLGRILLISRVGKRILSVIVVKEDKHAYYILTARDAGKKERRQLYEKEKKQIT